MTDKLLGEVSDKIVELVMSLCAKDAFKVLGGVVAAIIRAFPEEEREEALEFFTSTLNRLTKNG